ncbi:MBL fold metallo-hydrolase [bacterium LRH843]|nr:MBL fold metallo-hydrolase [bacterium LRH843]
MKSKILFLYTFIFMFSLFAQVSAHPGKLDAHGGHTCWTKCANWGLKNGEYHTHPTPSTPKQEQRSDGIFSDVSSHWAKSDIEYLANLKLIDGYPDGSFGVNKPITRAEVAAILTRDLNLPASKPAFTDVKSDHWANGSIGKVAGMNVISGYPNGAFKPNAPVSREELASILVRAYKLSGTSTTRFYDVEPGSWSYPSIQTLVANKITDGYPNGSFKPTGKVTRAEFSSLFTRTIKFHKAYASDTGKELSVSFIDVDQGDAILIQTPDRKSILVDGGKRAAGEKVVSYLAKAGVTSVDMLVATHPDADHIGGLVHVIESLPIKKVLDSGKTHTTQTYLDYLTVIDEKSIPFELAKEGQTINVDPNVTIRVLNTGKAGQDNNESSIVLKVTYGSVSYLLAADAGVSTEAEMISKYNVKSTILKVGHHGSNGSTSQAFVNAVKPEAAILSVGEDNSYGHPTDAVVNRLDEARSKLYSTARSGDIVVKTNGKTYSVTSSK